MTGLIYHLTTRTAWSAGQKTGEYRADSMRREAFIHCSKAAQLLRVANAYYSGQSGVVILKIDPSRLKPSLKWESGSDRPDELFPHIYGPLNLEAVLDVIELGVAPDGTFSLPAGVI